MYHFCRRRIPLQEGLLWVGSDDGLIHLPKTVEKLTNVTPKECEWMMINSIEPSPFDAGTCYVAGTRYKMGDFSPYFIRQQTMGQLGPKSIKGLTKNTLPVF